MLLKSRMDDLHVTDKFFFSLPTPVMDKHEEVPEIPVNAAAGWVASTAPPDKSEAYNTRIQSVSD